MTLASKYTDHVKELPLVLACSGGDATARLSYDLAITLAKDEIAEMACLMSIQDARKHQAISQRDLIVIDGCGSGCIKQWLRQNNLKPTYYFNLATGFDLSLSSTHDYSLKDLYRVLNKILSQLPRTEKNPVGHE